MCTCVGGGGDNYVNAYECEDLIYAETTKYMVPGVLEYSCTPDGADSGFISITWHSVLTL